jgi:hypothetical protein
MAACGLRRSPSVICAAPAPGRIYIELINYPMLFKLKASAAEFKAGLDFAIEHGPTARKRRSR